MAEFKLMGRFIALSEVREIPSSEAGKAPIKKREMYVDCTRIDYFTHQPIGQENKVVLVFGGDKVLDKLAALNMQKDDVIAVEFNIVGTPYTDKQSGKKKVFTSIRCYDVEVVQRASQQQAAPVPQPQPAPAPQPAPTPEPTPQMNDDGQEPLPF